MYRGVYIFHPCFVQLFAGPFFSLKFAIERLFGEVWLCWHWYLCVNWSIVAWPEVRSDLFTLLEISRGEYYVHYLFLEFSFGNILKWRDGVFVTIVFCSYLQDTSSFWRLFWDVLEVDLWRWLWCELMLRLLCLQEVWFQGSRYCGRGIEGRVGAYLLDRCL